MYPNTKIKHITPLTTDQIVKDNKPMSSQLCICKTFRPILFFAKLLGFFPVSFGQHQDGKCVFKKCRLWFVFSIFLIVVNGFQICNSMDINNLTKIKSLPILLNNITNLIYGIYIVVLTTLNLYRCPRWIQLFNGLSLVLKEGILCQSARKTILKVQYFYLAMLAVSVIVQFGLLGYLHFSSTYKTNFDFNIYLNKFIHTSSFAFYIIFFSVLSFFMGILACFEKLTISCLSYTPVHPMKGIQETNNTRDFFGFFTYQLCKSQHARTFQLANLNQIEVVEFLRILHEEISLVIYEFNNCMNPQLLCHTVVELTVLILQWYAVVVYLAFTFHSPMVSTIHVLNCLFVVMHTIGLFLFLRNAQHLKNMVRHSSKIHHFQYQSLVST